MGKVERLIEDFSEAYPLVTLHPEIAYIFVSNLEAKEHFTGEVSLDDFLVFIRNFNNNLTLMTEKDYEKANSRVSDD